MSFKPSENEERYFAQLEVERRRLNETRRGYVSASHGRAGSGGTGRHAPGAASNHADGQEG